MPAVSAQTLIEAAVALGYDALSHRGLMECLLYATTQASGGSGSTNALEAGSGDPSAPPTNQDEAALYYNMDNGVMWQWNKTTHVWY